MFTGIIEEIGKITTITDKNIIIDASEVLQDAKIGDSIAVNGICLTVTGMIFHLKHRKLQHFAN